MNPGTAKRLSYDPDDRDSIFHRVGCQEDEKLSSVIGILDWGSSKRIRSGGFRVSHSEVGSAAIDHPDYNAIGKLKHNNIKDPNFKFKRGRTYVSAKNGRSIAVIIIN